MIALWHAFAREQFVQNCMERTGFGYSIAVAFPHGSVLEVARSLDLKGDLGSMSRSMGAREDFLQVEHTTELSNSELDRYYMALFGESAHDVAHFDATGLLPEGRNDFAVGGCRRAAWDEIPGHYVLRDELLAEVREAKVAESSKIEPCITSDGLMVESLEELDAAFDEVSRSEMMAYPEFEQSMKACEEALLDADAAARERAQATVFARHESRLHAHHKDFDTVLDKIESDREFLRYLDGLVVDLEREFAELEGQVDQAPEP